MESKMTDCTGPTCRDSSHSVTSEDEAGAEIERLRAALIRMLGAHCVGDLCHTHDPDCRCVHHEARAAIGERRAALERKGERT